MPITDLKTDPEALTLTVEADFKVPLRRLWDAYVDPRQIEAFWGPEEYPATFTRHDGFAGGFTEYAMIGADGERFPGYWEWIEVEAPNRFVVFDGFANNDGSPNPDMPVTRIEYRFSESANGSHLTSTTYFNSQEEVQQLTEMGMIEGLRSAMGQIDSVLEDRSYARHETVAQLLSDTQVRLSRVVRGSLDEVWRAHVEPELLRKWQLGPEGWKMTVAEIPTEVGGISRTEWEPIDDTEAQGFGFTGELLEFTPPHRHVMTESMIGVPGKPSTNEMTLTELESGTLVSLVITYPSKDVRDIVLETGMTAGVEGSYQRLERDIFRV